MWIATGKYWNNALLSRLSRQSLLHATKKGPQSLDIVIASYANHQFPALSLWSDIPSIAGRIPRWIRYHKGDNSTIMTSGLQDTPSFDDVIHLPNIGREGHTFLHHIINNFHDLAEHTIFCQETPHENDRVIARLQNLFVFQTGFLALGGLEHLCHCSGECFGVYKKLGEYYAMAQQRPCLGAFFVAFKGCFVVSRKRITKNPLPFYKTLHQLMEAPTGHTVHNIRDYPSYLSDSSPSDPALGHILERSWAFIFRCNSTYYDQDECTNIECVGPQCLDHN
jgi:hypothetical protein